MTRDQERLMDCLCIDEPYAADELASELEMSDDRVRAALAYLESKGIAQRVENATPTGWVRA